MNVSLQINCKIRSLTSIPAPSIAKGEHLVKNVLTMFAKRSFFNYMFSTIIFTCTP